MSTEVFRNIIPHADQEPGSRIMTMNGALRQKRGVLGITSCCRENSNKIPSALDSNITKKWRPVEDPQPCPSSGL